MSSSNRVSSRARRVLAALARYTRTGIRSERDVRAWLRRRGFSEPEAARLIAQCRARSVIDDRAGACLWAEQWARRGYAWAAIRERLAARGFEDAAIAPLARRFGNAEAETARAEAVVAGGRGESRARLARRLAARGFDDDLITRVMGDDAER